MKRVQEISDKMMEFIEGLLPKMGDYQRGYLEALVWVLETRQRD